MIAISLFYYKADHMALMSIQKGFVLSDRQIKFILEFKAQNINFFYAHNQNFFAQFTYKKGIYFIAINFFVSNNFLACIFIVNSSLKLNCKSQTIFLLLS